MLLVEVRDTRSAHERTAGRVDRILIWGTARPMNTFPLFVDWMNVLDPMTWGEWGSVAKRQEDRLSWETTRGPGHKSRKP